MRTLWKTGLLLALTAAPLTALAEEDEDYQDRIDEMLSGYEQAHENDEYSYVLLGVDFVPGVGSSSRVGDRQVRVFSANVIGGYSAGLVGVEGAGVINIESDFVHGVQGAGVINVVDGPMGGAQGAGVINVVDGPVSGVQAAGIINVVDGRVGGVQGAGVMNVADGNVSGVQAAGVINVVDGDVNGIQAGVVNITSGEVRGVQVGVINIADNVEGVPIGLVNIYPDGRFHIDGWVDETGQFSHGIKHGNDWMHNIYALGFNPIRPLDLSVTLGVGVHWELPGPLFANLDGLHRHNKVSGVPWGTLYMTNTLRGVVGLTLAPKLSLIAGPSFNVLSTTCGPPEGARVRPLNTEGSVHSYAWPGFSIGIQLL